MAAVRPSYSAGSSALGLASQFGNLEAMGKKETSVQHLNKRRIRISERNVRKQNGNSASMEAFNQQSSIFLIQEHTIQQKKNQIDEK